MRHCRTIFLSVAAVIIFGVSCSSDDTASTTSSSAVTTTTIEVTTTSQASSTTVESTVPSSSEPVTVTTVESTVPSSSEPVTVTVVSSTADSSPAVENEDWVAVVQGLANVRTELYATADPSRAGEVCAEGAFCYDQLVAQLSDAQSKGQHVEDQLPFTVLSGELETFSDNDGVEIVAVITLVRRSEAHGRVVDEDGDTVFVLVPEGDLPAEGNIRWTLVRVEGSWRIFDQGTLT